MKKSNLQLMLKTNIEIFMKISFKLNMMRMIDLKQRMMSLHKDCKIQKMRLKISDKKLKKVLIKLTLLDSN